MQPERILLLRSGRHLQVAREALAARFPGCRVGVVGTPGSRPAIEQAGTAAGDTFIYEGGRFRPLALFCSRTGLAVRQWRYDRVAILWNDPEGTGQGNVDRTACVMSPRGYLAITPDGTIVERAVMPQVTTELLRVVASVGIAAMLGGLLYLPAMLVRAVQWIVGFRAPGAAGPAEAGHYTASASSAASASSVVASGFSRTGAAASAPSVVASGFSRTGAAASAPSVVASGFSRTGAPR
jgi:hypothetical protein